MPATLENPAVATTKSVESIAALYRPSDAAKEWLLVCSSPSRFLEHCLEQRLFADAVEFLAYWLPSREAVWWGVLGMWWRREEETEAFSSALDAVIRWLQEPTDPQRRALREFGRTFDKKEPIAMLCESVFWTGNLSLQPDFPNVDPPEGIANRRIFFALRKMVKSEPVEARDYHWRQLLQFGLEVRQGKNDWRPDEE